MGRDKGKNETTWGKLTEDDFKIIQGNHQEIYGKLQKYYGYMQDRIKKEIENFLRT